jgi:UDP-glucose:glycoprotein glucosyltransferase
VLVLDLSHPAALHTLTGAVANIVARGLPFRFGVVPLAETEEGMSSFRNRWTSAD